jgi:hypothetical protein
MKAKPTSSHLNLTDEQLLSAIREVLKVRPTYGYRRVHILVNRYLTSEAGTTSSLLETPIIAPR